MRTLRHISVRRGQHYHRSETSPALTNPLLLHPEKITGKFEYNSRTFQGPHGYLTVFKD